MKRIFFYLSNFFVNIFYAFLSLFWKRYKSIVLFDCWFGEKFADNPRFLFQYLTENKSKLNLTHVIWVTRNKNVLKELLANGYECYMIDSKESKYFHKHAKYHIINNNANTNEKYFGEVLGKYSYGAVRINLWHGIAGKGVKFCNKEKVGKLENKKIFIVIKWLYKRKFFRQFIEQKGGWGNCYFLAQSKFNKDLLKKCFLLPDSKIIITGYPRVCECVLMQSELKIIELLKNYKCIFLYLPTFRSNTDFDINNLPTEINDVLREKNCLWIQKSHSASKEEDISFDNSNVLILDRNFDINVLIPFCDILVTDYSSCFLDAMYFKKGLFFYIPDANNYINNDRGLMVDINIDMCGIKIYNLKELKERIKEFCYNPNSAKASNYNEIYNKFWSETNNCKIKDIWNDIIEKCR